MRILLASNFYPPNFNGGAEIVAHNQARVLQSLGHEVIVFAGETHAQGDHYEVRRDEWEGVPVRRIAVPAARYERHNVNFSRAAIEGAFARALDGFRPDVFHMHNPTGLSVALPRLAHRAGTLTLATLHDHWGFCAKYTLLKDSSRVCGDFSRCAECFPALEDGEGRSIPTRLRNDFVAMMLSHVDAFLSPSRYLAQTYISAGFPGDRFHVLPNGIDTRRFLAVKRRPSEGALRLSYVGSLSPHKGLITLAKALGRLPANASISVNVVGDGSQRNELEHILAEVKRAGWVKFWGRIDHHEIETVYAETDVLVLPSIWPENQPVSITEAMACGIPAIVADLGGMPELIQDEVSGRIFAAGDAWDLARCIQAFLDSPGLVARYGAAARNRIAEFDIHAQVAHLTGIYERAGEPPATPETPRRLVVCSGASFEPGLARMLDDFPAADGWRFVLREWIDADLARLAWLHWVVDSELATGHVLGHHPPGVPMLVPIQYSSLRDVARARRIGLYYADAKQAGRCLHALETREDLRETLTTPRQVSYLPTISGRSDVASPE